MSLTGLDPVSDIGEFQWSKRAEQGRLVHGHRVFASFVSSFDRFSLTIARWLPTLTKQRSQLPRITPLHGTRPLLSATVEFPARMDEPAERQRATFQRASTLPRRLSRTTRRLLSVAAWPTRFIKPSHARGPKLHTPSACWCVDTNQVPERERG